MNSRSIWHDFRRKLIKLAHLLRTRRFLRPLAFGVAAACEHTEVLAGLTVCTVIDVGANKGQFSALALELFPGATIYAFEPLAQPFARLAAWSACEPRLVRHPMALTRGGGRAIMQVAARVDSSSLRMITDRQVALFPRTQRVRTEEVAVARLDSVLSPEQLVSPVLLKIDVQGSELDVLAGAGELLSRFEWIYVECSFVELYVGQALVSEVEAFLAAAGFLPLVYWNICRDDANRPVQADILFGAV